MTASNAELGKASVIQISRASSSFTHTLTYAFGSATGRLFQNSVHLRLHGIHRFHWQIRYQKRLRGTCTITCTTYNGSTNIGSKTCTLTLSVPTSIRPSITSLTVARVDGEVPSAWGIYVQTKSSNIKINGAAGATDRVLLHIPLQARGYTSTASSFTTGFLNTEGTITFSAVVTDSGGELQMRRQYRLR